MPYGVPKTEEERIETHKAKYGEESEPPAQRQGLGAYRNAGINWTWIILAFLAGFVVCILLKA